MEFDVWRSKRLERSIIILRCSILCYGFLNIYLFHLGRDKKRGKGDGKKKNLSPDRHFIESLDNKILAER